MSLFHFPQFTPNHVFLTQSAARHLRRRKVNMDGHRHRCAFIGRELLAIRETEMELFSFLSPQIASNLRSLFESRRSAGWTQSSIISNCNDAIECHALSGAGALVRRSFRVNEVKTVSSGNSYLNQIYSRSTATRVVRDILCHSSCDLRISDSTSCTIGYTLYKRVKTVLIGKASVIDPETFIVILLVIPVFARIITPVWSEWLQTVCKRGK